MLRSCRDVPSDDAMRNRPLCDFEPTETSGELQCSRCGHVVQSESGKYSRRCRACVHVGAHIRGTAYRRECGNFASIAVYACEIHGECTIDHEATRESLAYCSGCESYKKARPAKGARQAGQDQGKVG